MPSRELLQSGAYPDSERDKAMDKIEKAYELISNEYVEKVDREKLLEGAIQGMLSTLNDPYSVYMDKQDADNFIIRLQPGFFRWRFLEWGNNNNFAVFHANLSPDAFK